MAAEAGYLTIKFAGQDEALQAINCCIRDKVKELQNAGKLSNDDDPGITGWEFLRGYDHSIGEINSELIIQDTFNSVVEIISLFVKEVPNASFRGELRHDWLISSGPGTKLKFVHIAGFQKVWYSDGDTCWIWDAATGESQNCNISQDTVGYFVRKDVNLCFPLTISVEKTNVASRNERIEKIHVGDRLALKADWDNADDWPVQIEVFDTAGGSLGCLYDSKLDNTLVQLANELQNIKATVKSVTPLSKRRKNAKYALLDVELQLEDGQASDVAGHAKSNLAQRQQAGAGIESERKQSKDRSMKEIKDNKAIFPMRFSTYSIRKTRIAQLKKGVSVKMVSNATQTEIQLLNDKGEVFAVLACGSFGYISDTEAQNLDKMELSRRILDGHKIIAHYLDSLTAKVSKMSFDSRRNPTIEILVEWR